MSRSPSKTILIIDDDHSIRALVRSVLDGHTILEAPDGARGLALACTRRPDLILLDRMLPHLDGLEALRALYEDPATSSIPVIILSALSGADDRLEGLAAGALDYVTKPFNPGELAKRVASVLAQTRGSDGVSTENSSCDAETIVGNETRLGTGNRFRGKDRTGDVIDGKYLIQRRIDGGGMADVYEARHELLDKTVALKLIRADRASRPSYQRRFFREARLASSLDHPNVVSVHDSGRTPDGELYLVMDLLEGRTLRAILDAEGALSPARAVSVTGQLLEGLAAAHHAGVLHRDIKASNIMIRSDGALQILDFGLARHVDAEPDVTQAGQSIGTPLYMSPEQATGSPTDNRTDIYSVGVVLYELLCGSPPFVGDNGPAIMRRHCTEAPLEPSSAGEGIPLVLDPIVLKALSKSPADRWPSAEAFRDALVEASARF